MKTKGYTLIELLIVIFIITILSSIIIVSTSNARKKARDARRLQDMEQIQNALALYLDDHGEYPSRNIGDCGSWDVGNKDLPFMQISLDQYMGSVPTDPSARGNCDGYRYYRYGPGAYDCDIDRGQFYVLFITDMETENGKSLSPGFSCIGNDWIGIGDWVIGSFEK